jgi:hypothetical protein
LSGDDLRWPLLNETRKQTMRFHHQDRLARARRRGAQGLVALVAGLAVTAAWSAKVAGIEYGGTANPTGTQQSASASAAAASGPAKPASRPASAAKR